MTQGYGLDVQLWKAATGYSSERLSDLARKTIHAMQRVPATCIFSDDYKHRSLWDEFFRA